MLLVIISLIENHQFSRTELLNRLNLIEETIKAPVNTQFVLLKKSGVL